MNGRLFLRAVPILIMVGSTMVNSQLLAGQAQGELVSGKILEGSTGSEDHASCREPDHRAVGAHQQRGRVARVAVNN